MFVNSDNSNSVPPPPPPPPPPPLPRHQSNGSSQRNERLATDAATNWRDDLEKSYERLNSDGKYTGFYIYNHVESIIQEGPTCGLVALVMASRQLNMELTVDHALQTARHKRYSGFGEMFSVLNMKELAEDLINVEATVLKDLGRNKTKILEHLVNGWPLLVPYDADANHEPARKGGHRAHWAVIIGFCLLSEEKCNDNKLNTLPRGSDFTTKFKNIPDNLLILLAKQGKSRHTKWWSFDRLFESNRGLQFINPKIGFSENCLEYVLPENGNLEESLADKFLMIKPK